MKNLSVLTRQTLWLSVFLLFLMTVSTSVALAEIKDGDIARDILVEKVRILLHQEKYAELESMAKSFRDEKTRFSDGVWKLPHFYKAFNKTSYGWIEHFSHLDKWLKKYPLSVTPRVAAAEAWISYAWEARGSGYANTVTEEGWKLKRERLARAYEFVKSQPDASAVDCPHRYSVLLAIARTQGWNRQEYEKLFQKAISVEPSYISYYVQKTAYLLPRWNGKDGEWQKFAAESVKLTPSSEGMGMYTNILITAWLMDEFKQFNEPDISWEKMKQGFRDIERQYPNSPYNLNYFCMFACIAGDKKTAKELFKRIGDEPYVEVWKGRSNFTKWQRWAGVN